MDYSLVSTIYRSRSGRDLQSQQANNPNPKANSIQVVQKINLSSSSSSSSAERLSPNSLDLIESAASSIVNATQRIVTEIRADMVPNAEMRSSVLVSCAGH
jgi:hypothetical protein